MTYLLFFYLIVGFCLGFIISVMGGLIAVGIGETPKDKIIGAVSQIGVGFLIGVFWPIFLGYILFLLILVTRT